jgi:hypothetical protein
MASEHISRNAGAARRDALGRAGLTVDGVFSCIVET